MGDDDDEEEEEEGDGDREARIWLTRDSPEPVSAPDMDTSEGGKWVVRRDEVEMWVAGPTTKNWSFFTASFVVSESNAELGLGLDSACLVQSEDMLSEPSGGEVRAAFNASTARWEVKTMASNVERNSAGLENKVWRWVSAVLEKVCVRTGRNMGV